MQGHRERGSLSIRRNEATLTNDYQHAIPDIAVAPDAAKAIEKLNQLRRGIYDWTRNAPSEIEISPQIMKFKDEVEALERLIESLNRNKQEVAVKTDQSFSYVVSDFDLLLRLNQEGGALTRAVFSNPNLFRPLIVEWLDEPGFRKAWESLNSREIDSNDAEDRAALEDYVASILEISSWTDLEARLNICAGLIAIMMVVLVLNGIVISLDESLPQQIPSHYYWMINIIASAPVSALGAMINSEHQASRDRRNQKYQAAGVELQTSTASEFDSNRYRTSPGSG